MYKSIFYCLTIAFISISSPSLASKQKTSEVHAEYVSARLLLPRYDIREETVIQGAIELRLKQGWHTYWRHAGDVGLPISTEWVNSSKNIEDINIRWPAPLRFEVADLQNFGYKDTVTLPIDIHINDTTKDANIVLDMNVMMCKEICIPQIFKLSQHLIAVGDDNQTGHDGLIQAAIAKLPHKSDTDNISLSTAVLGPDAIVFTAHSVKGFRYADIFLEHDQEHITSKPEFDIDDGDKTRALIKIAKPENIDNLPEALKGSKLRATFTVRGQAIEKYFSF